MCNFGVPQGSVLGPLLFLSYINDINHSLNKIIFKRFADDTNCFFSGGDFNSLIEIVKREMNSLQNWINTKYQSTKYLGIILDDKMTWKAHIAETTSKIAKFAGIFAKVRYMMPRRCLITMHNSLSFPKINYGTEAYGNTTLETLRPIKVAQNRILKIRQFKPHKSNKNKLYSGFLVLKMKDIFKYSTFNITHKYIHKKEAVPQALHTTFYNMMIYILTILGTRRIYMPKRLTITYGVKQISYITRQCWNELLKEIEQKQIQTYLDKT